MRGATCEVRRANVRTLHVVRGKLSLTMAITRQENVVVSLIFLPAGIAVNALLLWGFRDQINLRDPLFWVFQAICLAAFYRIGRAAHGPQGLAR